MLELLEDKKFLDTLATIAVKTGRKPADVLDDAHTYLKELYTEVDPTTQSIALRLAEMMLERGYDHTIDTNPEEIKKLTRLMRKHPIAFVMTHKTYIDMAVLAVVLVRHGLPLPYTFAGINMAFTGLAQAGRKLGAIFIRRSFANNPVYKYSLRHFIASVVKAKGSFMWAIEGTRSRTGKLVWPKMGILKYVAEAAQYTKKEVKYIPVSVVYDLIPDVKDMTAEGRGRDKNPESLSWFINYVRDMNDDLGKISLRFGDPVEPQKIESAPDEGSFLDMFEDSNSELPKFAFELAYRINQVTPVTTTSLVCAVLLSKFSLTKRALESDVASLMQLIESHDDDALVDRGKPIGETVRIALDLLIKSKIVNMHGTGVQARYAIDSSQYLPTVYYANMAVQHLVNRSFIELALVSIADKKPKDRQLAFWQEIMNLRDLFKFEFFYSRKEIFSDEIEHDLSHLNPDWEAKMRGTGIKNYQMLRDQQVLVTQSVLYPYMEAYRIVAQALLNLDTNKPFSESALLQNCLMLGEEMHFQGKIQRVEAVSKPFMLNGIRLAQNKNLIPSKENPKTAEITAFMEQLDDVAARMGTLQSIIMERPKAFVPDVPIERDIVPGSKMDNVTKDVVNSEGGSHIGAFFDLDRTLIEGFSAKEFFQNRLFSGRMTPQEVVAQFGGVIVYAMGNGNFAGLAAVSARGVQGTKEQVFIEVGEEVYTKHLADAIYPESRALVAAHMAKGHTVAIISAATPYQVDPIARDLGIEHVMCTRMEVVNGKFSGKIVEPACWGDGKAFAARELAKEHNLDLAKSYFYTDSAEDMALLEIVGKPRPLNPDADLAAVAFQRDWPVMRFDGSKRPGVGSMVRTGMLAGSMVPAALRGMATGAINLSWQDGVNTMMETVGDLGLRSAGVKLVVKGEENMWNARPAVFIFNHQSSTDLFIMAKLMRKDATGVAKKELQYSPLGPLMMAAGIVFVDRADRKKAIESLKQTKETLQSGISIAIAPEGTRSYDYKLGVFKKGAFHIAMNAGVPIVPVVIKNAHDAMPRGSSVVRSTAVEVVVLPAVHTDNWHVDTIDDHIEMVRNMYLKELGQLESVK
ncbi:MAG: HAD-IB family hydrolase [Chloroflexota bacterium]